MKRFLTTFNGGEISPDLYGRFDISKVVNGCKTMLNWLPTIQGTTYFRGGWKFISEVKDSSKRVFLADFTYNEFDTYTLEFGDKYLRFFRNQQPLMQNDLPIEFETPYDIDNLFDDHGVFMLRKAQSGDVMYIFHSKEKYPVYCLERNADMSFSFFPVNYAEFGGFEDLNKEKEKTVYSSAVSGTITLTSNTPIFKNGHIGGLFFMEMTNFEDIYSWSEGKSVIAGQKIRSNDNTYTAVEAGTTGASKPIHTEGIGTDGNVKWKYEDSGYGIAKITAVGSDGLTATAEVLVQLPADVVGNGKKTWKWKFGSWCNEYGYPSTGCFYRERFVLMRGRRVWFSWIGDYEDFSERDYSQLTYETGFAIEASAGSVLGNVQWMESVNKLIFGSSVNICSVSESDYSTSFSIYNCRSEEHDTVSNRPINPIKIGQRMVFINASGKEAFVLSYDDNTNRYSTDSLCTFAKHINQEGIIATVHQKEPFNLIYCLRQDGQLSILLYDPMQEGLCWAQMKTDGFIESISMDGNVLTAVIRRKVNINGEMSEKRYIEAMQNPFQAYFEKNIADFNSAKEYDAYRRQVFLEAQKKMIYLDSAVLIEKDEEFSEITSGLDHLAGREVSVVTDGGREISKVVTHTADGWGIDLELPCKRAVVGLPYKGILIPMGIADQTQTGNTIIDIKRIYKVGFIVHNSVGGQMSDGSSEPRDIISRTGRDIIDEPVPLKSGIIEPDTFSGDLGREDNLVITQPYPYPFCLQAIIYDYERG